MIYSLENLTPQIGDNNFIAPNTDIIGDVKTGHKVSIWFGARLRADLSPIIIGDESNIQDNAVIHGDPGFPIILGKRVTIGHGAILHGCKIDDGSVIGMGSILLNGVHIPKNCLVGAGSVVSANLKAEEGDLIIGNPAKVIKKLSPKHMEYLEFAYTEYTSEIDKYNNKLIGEKYEK